MTIIMRIFAALTTAYTILVFLRVMLTWVEGPSLGRSYELLSAATDPYLDWFRRFPALRRGNFDFSPVLALALLMLASNIFNTIGTFGRITLGIVLAMLVSGLWSAVAFVFDFFIIVLALRLFASLASRGASSPFWRLLDTLSRPFLYRFNRLIFRDRLVDYRTSLITAIIALLSIRILVSFAIHALATLFAALPL